MARKKGICTLCGKGGQLTFEHVPPNRGGNVHGVVMHNIDEWLARESLDGPWPGGRLQPEGTGSFALCAACNGKLGVEYVPAFIDFVVAGAQIMQSIGPEKLAELDKDLTSRKGDVIFRAVNRLRVAKQIVSMMLVTCGRGFVEAHPSLAAFVADPSSKGLPAAYRLFLTLTPGPFARVTGQSGSVDLETHKVIVCAEVAYPPFEYLLVINGAEPDRAGEITDWANAADEPTEVQMTLPIGFCHTAFPGDLRSRAQVDRDTAANLAAAEIDARQPAVPREEP